MTMFGNMRKIEEEILGKYKVEDSKRGAHRGRGEPLEWRMVLTGKKYQPRKRGEDCWARIFSLFREYDLQRKQGTQKS